MIILNSQNSYSDIFPMYPNNYEVNIQIEQKSIASQGQTYCGVYVYINKHFTLRCMKLLQLL